MNKATLALMAVLVAGGAWLAVDAARRPPAEDAGGISGMDFVIPPEYRVFELGEADYASAARELLEPVASGLPAAAVFTREGSTVHLLAHPQEDRLDEHVQGRSGVLRKILWPGGVVERLRWAADHGSLDAPGLESPQDRNAYHE